MPAGRNVEGVVEMILEATQNYLLSISEDRFFVWHSSLFSAARSGMSIIEVGRCRSDEMQIVSGAMGKERNYFALILIILRI